MSEVERDAYLSDLGRVVRLDPGSSVLDVGAGAGALCGVLARLPGLELTALEPSAAVSTV